MPSVMSNWDAAGMTFYVDGKSVLRLDAVPPSTSPPSRAAEPLNPQTFPNAVARLERALPLLDELNIALDAYWKSARWEWNVGVEPSTGDFVIRLTMLKELPLAIGSIVADALNNMRGALNMLVMDMVRANNQVTTRQHQFPTSESLQKYVRDAPKRLLNVPAKARRYIDRLRPWQGANDVLWDLSRLRNTRDHDIVVPVVLAKIKLQTLAGMPGVFTGPDGTINLLGGPPGSRPTGYEKGMMTPRSATQVGLIFGAASELFRGPGGIAHIQLEPHVDLTVNIGPDAGSLDLLWDYYLMVNRIIAVAQRKLA